MNATRAVEAILRAVPDGLFVSSLGTATSALRAASDDGPHLYLGGAMGSALATAIGVAEKRSRARVVAIVGDGELLMGASSLWTLGASRAANLTVAILCDGRYSITGGQPLGARPAFVEVAHALGLPAARAESEDEIARALADGARRLVEIPCEGTEWPGPSPFVDPPVVRWRFEQVASSR